MDTEKRKLDISSAENGSTLVVADETVAIEVHDLVKRYPKVPVNAVDKISFAIRQGEIFGLLGPNGAGKTTTISMLTSSMLPTSGTIHIMGIDIGRYPTEVKRRIAVVPQRSNLDQSLHARDILIFHAAYHNVPHKIREARADELLAELGLTRQAKQKTGYYSGGMAQRIMLARALMHSPDVIFLDEPTHSLDPQSRLFLWERIRSLKEKGTTIFLTTHDMMEAEQLCDRIAIMDHGRILVLGTTAELKRLIPYGIALEVALRIPGQPATRDAQARQSVVDGLQRALPEGIKIETVPPGMEAQQGLFVLRMYGEDVESFTTQTIQAVAEMGAELRDLHLINPSLEDTFIHLTGRNLRS